MAKKQNPDSITEYKRILAEIKQGDLKPVYVLTGTEAFLIDKLQDAFISCIPEGVRDFNFDLLYGQDVSPDRVLGIARSFPMMSEKRMVIVRDFLKMFEKQKALEGSAQEDREETTSAEGIIAYLQSPNPACITIFISEKSVPGNTKLGRAISTSAHVSSTVFENIQEHQLTKWITSWVVSEHQRTIDGMAAQMLAFSIGSDLMKLSTEIDKLCTYKKTGEEITQEDVKKLVGVSREFTVFELQDALIARDLDKTLTVAEHILQQSDKEVGEVIKTLGFLYGTFSKVWQIQSLSKKGLTPDQIGTAVGAKGYYLNKLSQMARKYPSAKMPEVFEILLDTDRAIKGFSKLDPSSVFMMGLKKIIL